MQAQLDRLREDVHAAMVLEHLVCGKTPPSNAKERSRKSNKNKSMNRTVDSCAEIDVEARVRDIVQSCRDARKRLRSEEQGPPSDAMLSKMARFTDRQALSPYVSYMNLLPRLVNVVRGTRPPHHHKVAHLLLNSILSRSPLRRRSPSPALAASCRSTLQRYRLNARVRTLHLDASQRCSLRTPTRAVEFWCFTPGEWSARAVRARCPLGSPSSALSSRFRRRRVSTLSLIHI